MINKKTETIQGFLTPTKLLSGIGRSNVKSTKANNSSVKLPLGQSTQNNTKPINNTTSMNQSVLSTSRQKDFKESRGEQQSNNQEF